MQLLDIIAYPGDRPIRPRIIIDTLTIQHQPDPDTVAEPENLLDTLAPQELLDTLCSKEGVIDTLRSAINFFSDFGSGTGASSTLMWTMMVALAALSFCFYFIYLYRHTLVGKR